MMYLLWVLLFIPNLLIYLACMILNPVVALFVTKAERTDRVKQLGNKQVTMLREYLIRPLYWFQTHDNAVDEYWWGCFYKDSLFPFIRNATQEQYDNSRFLRYVCRLFWLWRNCAYGFSYHLFGRVLDDAVSEREVGNEDSGYWCRITRRRSSFQYKAHIPVCPWVHLDLNFGWKAHRGFPRVMYAARIFSLRLG